MILHGKRSMPDLQTGAVGEGSGKDFENVIDPTDKKQTAGEKVQDTGSDLSHIKAVNSPIAQKNGQHQRKQLAFGAFIGICIATHILIIIVVVIIIDNNSGLLGIGLLIRLLIRLLVGLLIGILIGLLLRLLRLLIRLVGLLIRVLIGLLLIQLLVGLVRLIRFLIRLLVRVLIRLIRLVRLLTGLLHRLHGSAAIGAEICIFRIRAAIWTEHFLHSLTGNRFKKQAGPL